MENADFVEEKRKNAQAKSRMLRVRWVHCALSVEGRTMLGREPLPGPHNSDAKSGLPRIETKNFRGKGEEGVDLAKRALSGTNGPPRDDSWGSGLLCGEGRASLEIKRGKPKGRTGRA